MVWLAAKDIPVFVTEEMRKLYVASDQGQGSAVEALRKNFKTEENFCSGVWGTRYLDSFLLHMINNHDQCNKGNF